MAASELRFLSDEFGIKSFPIWGSGSGDINLPSLNTEIRFHKELIQSSAISEASLKGISFVRLAPRLDTRWESASSSTLPKAAQAFYGEIEAELGEMSQTSEESPLVEVGAAKTALELVRHLKKSNFAPPEMSWHGGDAIVMIWALGDTTYAITITEGELGYVVRQNKKAIRMADSISIDIFRLEDMR